jgi:pyrroline-5-carboxylate reductase
MERLVIVGGGRMGTALASGLIRAGRSSSSIAIIEKDSKRREELTTELPGVSVGAGAFDTEGPQDSAGGAVLAVKPVDAEAACRGPVGQGVPRILSLMAGVPTRKIEAWAGGTPSVMRAMPNTPALVGAGASALAGGSRATELDLDWAESILGSVGMVVRCDEADIDAVTGLSGSGPAYVFFLVEALTEAGVRAGLDPGISRRLARQTVVGAGRMLEDSDLEPVDLRRQVTSPGGTTAAGIAALETRDFAGTIAEAVEAATRRSAELGVGAPEAPDTKN